MNKMLFVSELQKVNMFQECVRDFDCLANVKSWSENKQVFQFDADFLDELLKTENLTICKNAWDFLPYQSFYVDVSANQELCKSISGKGFFVAIEKKPCIFQRETGEEDGSIYTVHLCKVDEKYFYHDVLNVPNASYDCTVEGSETAKIKLHEVISNSDERNSISLSVNEVAVNVRAYQIIIVQILNYLASIEPDIVENEESKKMYKPKQNGIVQDRYSEIRKWDVGVKYGSAFRKWKATEQNHRSIVDADNSEHPENQSKKPSCKRPHSRKAHWHHYWYGTGDDKILRPKWLNFTLVNVKKEDISGESPVVIHRCE